MKSIILAAGFATRLYPVTLTTPKSLLKINGKLILDYITEKIENINEIDEIIIISNGKFYNQFNLWAKEYKGEKIINVVNDNVFSNETRLGGLGDLYLAIKNKEINEDILIVAGDNLFDFELNELINEFNLDKITRIITKFIEDLCECKRFGVIEMDNSGNLIGFEEKPENPKSNYLRLNEYFESKGNKEGVGYFIQWLILNSKVKGFACSGNCWDIGTIESLNSIKKLYGEKI